MGFHRDKESSVSLVAANFTLTKRYCFPYVKEIFIDENYISVTKYEINTWEEITLELRTFIKQYIENGGFFRRNCNSSCKKTDNKRARV
jgi:hypothetical protein